MRIRIAVASMFITFSALAKNDTPRSIYDFKVPALDGKVIDFSKFKGKKILIVNTTTFNNHNPQYDELEALKQKYKNKLVVIGFLIEDFSKPPRFKNRLVAHMDPKDYAVTFPLTKLVEVKGDGEDKTPVYKWLTHKKYNHFKDSDVQWDFQKYLVNEKGKLVAEFDSDISVTDPKVIKAIEK